MKKKKSQQVVFKPYTMGQLQLPTNLEELIPENHLVRVVHEAIEKMDLGPLLRRYKGGGTSSYHPKMVGALFSCLITAASDYKLCYVYQVVTEASLIALKRKACVKTLLDANNIATRPLSVGLSRYVSVKECSNHGIQSLEPYKPSFLGRRCIEQTMITFDIVGEPVAEKDSWQVERVHVNYQTLTPEKL